MALDRSHELTELLEPAGGMLQSQGTVLLQSDAAQTALDAVMQGLSPFQVLVMVGEIAAILILALLVIGDIGKLGASRSSDSPGKQNDAGSHAFSAGKKLAAAIGIAVTPNVLEAIGFVGMGQFSVLSLFGFGG